MSDAASELVFVTLGVAGQLCGVPVGSVRDVLGEQAVTPIPLAPPAVAGSLNLRGRIVTAIDLRRRLDLPGRAAGPPMAIVIEHGSELFALLVDQVREVLTVEASRIEPTPPTLPPVWRHFGVGICQVPDASPGPGGPSGPMVVLDIDRLLAIAPETCP